MSWATEFYLRNLLHIARESSRGGWPVAATAWLGGRGCTAHFAHAQCRCNPRQTAGTSVRASFSIACQWRLPMRAEDLEALREDMLAVIAAGAFALRDTIGKS